MTWTAREKEENPYSTSAIKNKVHSIRRVERMHACCSSGRGMCTWVFLSPSHAHILFETRHEFFSWVCVSHQRNSLHMLCLQKTRQQIIHNSLKCCSLSTCTLSFECICSSHFRRDSLEWETERRLVSNNPWTEAEEYNKSSKKEFWKQPSVHQKEIFYVKKGIRVNVYTLGRLNRTKREKDKKYPKHIFDQELENELQNTKNKRLHTNSEAA